MEIEKIQKKFIELTESLGFKEVNIKVEKSSRAEIAHIKFKWYKLRKNVLDCKLLIGKYFNKYPEKSIKFLGHELGHVLFIRDHFFPATIIHIFGTPSRKSRYGIISFLPYICHLVEEGYSNLKAGQYGLKALTVEDYLDFY